MIAKSMHKEEKQSLTAVVKRALAVLTVLFAVVVFAASNKTAKASGNLDEIVDYEITVDVNQDGTLSMKYHIEWKVLDSDSEGPLTWVKVGIPNSHYLDYAPLSTTIKSMSVMSGGGTWLRIDLDRSYYKNETVVFEFSLQQDYMYQMNMLTEGETVYEFTPGWFNDIYVDWLVIRWNSDQVVSWSPSCEIDDNGYCTWETALAEGGKYKVQLVYANEAFAFDATKTIGGSNSGYNDNYNDYYDDYYDDYNYGYDSDYGNRSGDDSVAVVFMAVVAIVIFVVIIRKVSELLNSYSSDSGFTAPTKKILRTKVEYYPSCPGCGAPRPEGQDSCSYCGANFIKSEEKIEESDIPADETEIRNKRTSGTYRYTSSPNTYLRVNVINIPAPRRSSGGGSHRSGGGSHRSGGGGCAHSSCACACVSSCACACACACAGGGRAGCSVKDFYHTGLTLEDIRRNCR